MLTFLIKSVHFLKIPIPFNLLLILSRIFCLRLSAFMCTSTQKLNEAPGLGLHYGEERMLSEEDWLMGLFRNAELEHVALAVKGNPGKVVVIDLFDLHVLLEGHHISFAAFQVMLMTLTLFGGSRI